MSFWASPLFLFLASQPTRNSEFLTSRGRRAYAITEIDITESDVAEFDITENDITESDITETNIT